MSVETERRDAPGPALEIRLRGTLAVRRNGSAVALPASRKVRALVAYLALAPHPVTRSHLCELLWDVPNDPRGELRWCLSKARSILDTPERRRIDAQGDTVALDLSDCFVDAVAVTRAIQNGVAALAPAEARELLSCFNGDFA